MLNLIPGVAELKAALAVLLLAGLCFGGWDVWNTYHQVDVLKAQVTLLQTNQKTYAADLASCTAANKTDEATIAQLTSDRAAAQTAINQLTATTTTVQANLAQVRSQLAAISKLKGSDGALSPDLLTVLKGLK